MFLKRKSIEELKAERKRLGEDYQKEMERMRVKKDIERIKKGRQKVKYGSFESFGKNVMKTFDKVTKPPKNGKTILSKII